jgi:hypothetical protein
MFIYHDCPVKLSLPIPNNPLFNKSKIFSQLSLISLVTFLFYAMLVSHTLSMISPLICSAKNSFGVFDTSSFSEHTTALWKVALASLASFSLKIILLKELLTS